MRLTANQLETLHLLSEDDEGIAKGEIPCGFHGRARGTWWRNLDQLEARGLATRIGWRYIITTKGCDAMDHAAGQP